MTIFEITTQATIGDDADIDAKGTISRRVAARLGWRLLDSGALYRLVALAVARKGVSLDDVDGLADVARELDVWFASGFSRFRVGSCW